MDRVSYRSAVQHFFETVLKREGTLGPHEPKIWTWNGMNMIVGGSGIL